eukprot:COSAG02_NODE_28460_length_589_cov_0.834694_1_plen_65_part_01
MRDAGLRPTLCRSVALRRSGSPSTAGSRPEAGVCTGPKMTRGYALAGVIVCAVLVVHLVRSFVHG